VCLSLWRHKRKQMTRQMQFVQFVRSARISSFGNAPLHMCFTQPVVEPHHTLRARCDTCRMFSRHTHFWAVLWPLNKQTSMPLCDPVILVGQRCQATPQQWNVWCVCSAWFRYLLEAVTLRPRLLPPVTQSKVTACLGLGLRTLRAMDESSKVERPLNNENKHLIRAKLANTG
jgi:hypothetical protein